jgi:hypothetical protein
MSYFQAARRSIEAYQAAAFRHGGRIGFTGIAPIPYWENLFPDAAGGRRGPLTATQRMVRGVLPERSRLHMGAVAAGSAVHPACSIYGPYAFFNSQFDVAGGPEFDGRANYDSLQLTLRKRWSQGYQFDINYTLSGIEGPWLGGGARRERLGGGGYSGLLMNSWDPDLQYSYSDFDVRHQVNMNWVCGPALRPRAPLRQRSTGVGEPGHRRLAVLGHLALDERLAVQHLSTPAAAGRPTGTSRATRS